jgi:uncharacterized repeat protein (TIGR01451 family)
MKFVKSHTGLLRSARSGGSLGLRTTVLLLLGLSLLSNLGNPKTVWAQPPQPQVTLNVPAEVLIGEKFTFNVEFKNATSAATGFGPYLEVYLRARGIDSNGASQKCDGVSFVDARALFTNPPNVPLTPAFYNSGLDGAQCPNTINNPLAGVNGWNGPSLPPPITDYQLAVLLLPFGSFDPTQPAIPVEVEALMSDFADVGQALDICVRGGFRFGATEQNDPTTDPLVESTLVCAKTKPTAFKIKKEYLGPEDEAVAGPNFVNYYRLKYKITVDIADGQVIKNLTIDDILQNTLQYVQTVQVASLIPAFSSPPGPLTGPPCKLGDIADLIPPSTTIPGGTLTLKFCVPVVGTPATNDVTLVFEFYIPANVLDKDCKNAPVKVPNDVKATGLWDPLDPRDPNPTDPPGTTVPVTSDITTDDHILNGKCLAIQKKVEYPAGLHPIPDDVLKYTLRFQISDYHTIGQIKITDQLSDGQLFVNTPSAPMLTIQDQFGNYTNVGFSSTTLGVTGDPHFRCPATGPIKGTTNLVFDVSGALIAAPGVHPRHLAGILTGGFATILSPTYPPATTPAFGEIVFYAQIQDKFSNQQQLGDQFVDKHDPLTNCVEIKGDVFKNEPATIVPTQVIGSAQDDSFSQISIVTDILKKSVYAVKRGTTVVCGPFPNTACSNLPSAPQEVRPGDQVTFRIEYTIPSGDAENLTITDWLPLPIFDVGDPDANPLTVPPGWPAIVSAICTGIATPPPGNACRLMPGHTLTKIPTLTTSPPVTPVTNSLTFDYGTFNNTANTPRKIDLLFTLTVTHKPFADGLHLTNEAQECEDNTFTAPPPSPPPLAKGKFCQTAIAQVNVREPKLSIKKGVVATDNPHGQFGVYDPSTHTFTPGPPPVPTPSTPPSSCPRVPLSSTAPITSANLGSFINSDLNSVDAGDWVTFAIAIENTGGAPAYNIELADIIPLDALDKPSCFEPDFGGLCVTYGNGTPIPFTTAPGGHGRIIIKLDPFAALAPGAPVPANGTNIVIITFNAKLIDKDKLKSGCCDNKAELIYYGSTPPTPTQPPNGSVPPPNFVDAGFGGPFEDKAWVCVKPKPHAKCIQTTSELHTTLQQVPQGGTVDAAIGEIVRFRLITVIPEGTTLNFQIKDLLPQGLTYVGNPKAIFVANNAVTNTLGIHNVQPPHGGVRCPGPPPPPATPTPVPISVSPASFPFGTGTDPNFPAVPITTITNNDNDPDLEFLIIEFNAQVDNIGPPTNTPGNQDGVVLTNQFEVHYQDEIGNSFSSTSGPVYVKIVEPKLTMTKTVSATTVTQGATVTYAVTFTNTGTATAFDVAFKDTLWSTLVPVSNSLGISAPPAFGCTGGIIGQSIPVTCSMVPISGVVTITYQATVKAPCNTSVQNTAEVTWTSLPGPNGTLSNPTGSQTGLPPGSPQGERNGSDGLLNSGVLNDYQVKASAHITVVCPKDCATPPPSMVSWWPMDETSGNTVVDIWDGNNGTSLNAGGSPAPIGGGGPAYIQGQYVGNSLFFGGSYVDVSPATTLGFGTGEFSIDAWVEVPPWSAHPNVQIQPIVDKTAQTIGGVTGYALFIYYPANTATRQLGFVIDDGVSPPTVPTPILHTVPLSPGWHHVAVTVARPTSTATVTLYVDGAPSAPVTVTVGSTSNGAALWIGKSRLQALLNAGFQEVAIDELEIFKRALSQSEIQDIYSADKKGKCKSDLGDAPDSTNHANTQMDAYPNIPANFPTVYDPPTPGPAGPLHLNAKGDAWLGRDVTFEGEADQGGDQDGVNNIKPGTNTPNQDNADDGVNLPINLPTVGCGNVQFQYIVKVVGPLKPRYVNVWFDFNQDGDWQDVNPCSGTTLVAREWAVQNQMFNVGAGTYTFTTTPSFVGFRRTVGPPGMWMRITLTDTPVAPAHGADGSGPVGGYKFGETEDYLLDVRPGKKAEICVTKFHDLDEDGVQDPGEPGLPGWTFTVTPGGPTIITGSQGTFCFGVPAPGTYTISEVLQSGWTPTVPSTGTQTVTASPSQLVNLKFGNQKKDDDKKCDLKIEKFTDPSPPVAGQPFAFVVRVTNVGGAPCPPTTTVTDNLPSGFTPTLFNPNTAGGWSCPSGPPNITCTNPTLTLQPSQSSTVFVVVGTAPPGIPTVKNCAGVKNLNDTNLANNEVCISVPVAPPAGACDLVIGKSPSRGSSPLKSGQQATFELVVTNQGTGPCSAPIQVTDALPPGLTFVTGGPPPWTCVGPTCTYNLALAPGQSGLLLTTVNVTAPPGTSVKNCAGVKHPQDTNPANNEVCIGVPVAPPVERCDLAMRKSVSPNPATSGQPVTIALTVTNVGTGPCSLDTVVQDPRPAGLTFTAAPVANQPGWYCSLPGGNASCVTAGTMPPGYTATFTSTATVTAPPGGTSTNCATVSNPADSNPANNQSCAPIQVQRGVGPPPRPVEPKGVGPPPPPRPVDPKGSPPPPRPFDPKGLEGR